MAPTGTPFASGLCDVFKAGSLYSSTSSFSRARRCRTRGRCRYGVAAVVAGNLSPFVDAGLSGSGGGSSLQGTIAGAPSTGLINVVAVTASNGGATGPEKLAFSPSCPARGTSFTFPNLPAGPYQIFCLRRASWAAAQLLPGDPVDLTFGQNGGLPTCETGGPSCSAVFPSGNSAPSATVATSEAPENTVQYALSFTVLGERKILSVSVQRVQLPDGGPWLDLPFQQQGPPALIYSTGVQLGLQAPSLPYRALVKYADRTSETLTVGGRSYFTSVPQISIDTVQGAIDWTPPNGDGNGVSYQVTVANSSCQEEPGMPLYTDAGSLAYTVATNAAVQVLATDATGNTAQSEIGQCFGGQDTQASTVVEGTVLYSGTASLDAPLYLTLSQGPTGPPLAGTAVSARHPNFSIRSPSGGDTLTAWLDAAGSSHYVSIADAYAQTFTAGLPLVTVQLSDPNYGQFVGTPNESPYAYVGDQGFMVGIYEHRQRRPLPAHRVPKRARRWRPSSSPRGTIR